ncbi:hypothetical protein L2E82_30083 [Cichorium intybus]|uniref:Uncharacterized protein n=1 Tax=Cichorium intybus TaxID=13427 RepID=A0ACB9CZA5_CICIN|nr:hypothetical protein L2E82_30083 [Cichorium intybus]
MTFGVEFWRYLHIFISGFIIKVRSTVNRFQSLSNILTTIISSGIIVVIKLVMHQFLQLEKGNWIRARFQQLEASILAQLHKLLLSWSSSPSSWCRLFPLLVDLFFSLFRLIRVSLIGGREERQVGKDKGEGLVKKRLDTAFFVLRPCDLHHQISIVRHIAKKVKAHHSNRPFLVELTITFSNRKQHNLRISPIDIP